MEIVFRDPPMFEEINEVFHIANKEVIFAWGDKIYNPARIEIGPELMAHECVHGARQGSKPAVWWQRYLYDRQFRLYEEILAHREELKVLLGKARHRNDRRYYAKQIAARLASPLYGGLITPAKAKTVLTAEEIPSEYQQLSGNIGHG